jgi:putative flippase GtrA
MGQAVRFVAVGGANTALTGAIFLALSAVVAPVIAYTIAFAAGVLFAMIVTPRAVFAGPATRTRRAAYAAWYVFIYLVGLAVVYVADSVLGLSRWAIVAISIAVSATLGFAGARRLFHVPSGALSAGTSKRG